MRPIPTSVHGILDYLSVGTLFALPRVLRWPKVLTDLLTGMALSVLGYSLLTRYELGLFRRLPMPMHLRLDFMSTVATFAAALMFRRKNATIGPVLIGMGVFELAATLLSDPVPFKGQREAQRQFAHDYTYSPEQPPSR
jgi:hypothetical protein